MAIATDIAPDSVSLGYHQQGVHRMSSYSLDRRNKSSTLTPMEAKTLGHQHQQHLHQLHLNSYSQHRLSSYSLDRRNKYNTLTPLEAKKLSHNFMASNGSGGSPMRQPIRTASVRNKPRPPPMVVSTNLDDLDGRGSMTQSTYNQTMSAARIAPISPLEHQLANTVGLAPPESLEDSIPKKINDLEDSFASAKSHQSDTSILKSSLSRVSLVSSSTYKAFQKCNFKKFFRYMPNRRSLNTNDHKSSDSNLAGNKQPATSMTGNGSSSDSMSQLYLQQSSRSQTPQIDHNGHALYSTYGEFMPRAARPHSQQQHHQLQQLSLPLPQKQHQNQKVDLRSQSPASFPPPPPPPRDLKSVSYMEQASAISYSNYDEFTRVRNQQTSNLLSNHNGNGGRPRFDCPGAGGVGDDPDGPDEAWQLTSLPVYYERNLATVFEEKQSSATKHNDIHSSNNNNNNNSDHNSDSNDDYGKIKPPVNFDDKGISTTTTTELQINIDNGNHVKPITYSSQSLASVTTADSLLDLDYHRQVNTSFRFSYAQKSELEQALPRSDMGLPPRMPMNGTIDVKPSSSSCATTSSDSSMASDMEQQLNFFKARCTQLEAEIQRRDDRESEWRQQVECLKNKLTMEAKKNTDLELKQWSSEHLIGQLKKEISQLKTQIQSSNSSRVS